MAATGSSKQESQPKCAAIILKALHAALMELTFDLLHPGNPTCVLPSTCAKFSPRVNDLIMAEPVDTCVASATALPTLATHVSGRKSEGQKGVRKSPHISTAYTQQVIQRILCTLGTAYQRSAGEFFKLYVSWGVKRNGLKRKYCNLAFFSTVSLVLPHSARRKV